MNTAPTSSLLLAVKHPGSRRQLGDAVEPTASSSAKRLGHTTDFDGNYYHLKGARNEPKGPQRAYYGSPRYAQH